MRHTTRSRSHFLMTHTVPLKRHAKLTFVVLGLALLTEERAFERSIIAEALHGSYTVVVETAAAAPAFQLRTSPVDFVVLRDNAASTHIDRTTGIRSATHAQHRRHLSLSLLPILVVTFTFSQAGLDPRFTQHDHSITMTTHYAQSTRLSLFSLLLLLATSVQAHVEVGSPPPLRSVVSLSQPHRVSLAGSMRHFL